MKVLITGSSGFIGSYLAKKMKKEGFKVVTFDIKESKKEDVRNFEALLKKSDRCDVIIHLAALCIDSESIEKPHEYLTTNIVGTLNALEVARRIKVKKFLFASSAGVGKRTPYSLSKLIGEELCTFYNNHYNVPTYILRIYNVYGPGNKKGVIYNFVKNLMENKPIVINFDGKQERDFIHVEDVANSIIRLINESYEPGIFEIGTGKSVRIIDLGMLISSLMGKEASFIFKRPQINELRKSRAKKPFIKNYKKLEVGLKEVIEWMEQQ